MGSARTLSDDTVRWLLTGLLGVVACDDGGASPEARGLKVTVAPLHLAGIDLACYDLRVSGVDDVVFAQGDPAVSKADGDGAVCSDRYGSGAGGDIAFVGACDASPEADVDPVVPGVQNAVTLWVDGLYETGYVPITTAWQNPCGPAGCTVAFDCRENVDTAVAFDFTILRQSNTGFFDIVVEFEDIFCAAKVDCRYGNDTPATDDDPVIRLFGDIAGSQDLPTVVFALACSAGPGDEGTTRLYLSDVDIDCDGEDHDIVVPVNARGAIYTEEPPGFVAQALVSQGEKNLVSEDEMYWTVAVAMSPSDDADLAPVFAATNCRLRASGTASSGDIDIAFEGPNVSYPYLDADVALTDVDGNLVCTQHPVNEGNGVSTVYSALDGLPEAIRWEMVQAPEGAVLVAPYDRVVTE